MVKGRVLILVENLSVPFDRRVWLEARALKEDGYEVRVICPCFKGEKRFEVLKEIYIYRYKHPPATRKTFSFIFEFLYCFIITFLLSLWIFIRHNFDIIHACNPPDTFFALGLFYKIFGKRFYYDQHDLCPELYLAKFGKRKNLAYRLLLLLEYLTYKTADRVIVTNDFYRKIAVLRGGLDRSKVFTVRTGPDTGRFIKGMPDFTLKNGRRYLVTYLGVMAPQDGVDYLLRAINIIVNEYRREDILFALIGSGDSIADLKRLKRELDIDGAVVFTGRLPDEELQRYLATSDICVAPDPKNPLNDISTMNKILEYMAAARPMVSFDLKESRFSAGEAALYAAPNDIRDFADKILELLEHPERRNTMGTAGYKRLRGKLSWEYNKKRLMDVYNGT